MSGGDRNTLAPTVRLSRARELLDQEGVTATVTAAGREGEIAAVRGDPSLREMLARLAPEIRALGFRYVALELEPIEPGIQ